MEDSDNTHARDSLATAFVPDEKLVDILVTLGATRDKAVKALFVTGNNSADLAAAWFLENELEYSQASDSESEENIRMIFVVNKELEMGKGKVAAQVGHAAIGLYEVLCQDSGQSKYLQFWKDDGECKIVLKGDSTAHLLQLKNAASLENIPNYLVSDAGRTQIPEGSITVLSMFGKQNDLDILTGNLKLL